MAEDNVDVKSDSSADWTFPSILSWSAIGPARSHLSRQAASASMMGLEAMGSWLAASRQMVDFWRQSVRDVQDRSLAMYRTQIADALAREILADLEAPEPGPSARKPLSRTAVTKTNAVPAG